MKSLEELRAIKAATLNKIGICNDDADAVKVLVGMATCGIAAGARPILNAFTEEIEKRHLKNVAVSQTGCIGICQYEPIVEVYVGKEEKVTYVKMTAEKVARIVNDHIVNGNVVTEYTIGAATINK
ncbi:MAG: (2Fe-2S) ferredoxin domain-containing protein [Clostridiales bacterium]|jgi:NADP-reducing hydrogenase subunit HndB|nr:(2Fe-2S) ferredoxin domain-containing protein [Clostridiales bacterium]